MGKAGYHHKNLKEEMIANSIKIIGEEGYGKFSMRKVAKACGVSHAAPYRHFADKDSLLAAIFDQMNDKFDRILKSALVKYPDDAKSQLREMAYLYVKFFVENPEYMNFLFFSDLNKTIQPEDGSQNLLLKSQPYQTFIGAVERYRQSGTNGSRLKDQESLILSLWGLAQGISVLITQNYFPCGKDCLSMVYKVLWEGECIP